MTSPCLRSSSDEDRRSGASPANPGHPELLHRNRPDRPPRRGPTMNRTLSRWSLSSAVMLAGLSTPGPSFADPEERATDKVLVGYLYGQPRDINYRLYTHVCHAFLVADGEGNVRKARDVPSRELTGEAHRAGVRVLLSLGGWGWDKQFASIVSRPEAEERYARAVMEMV